MLELPKINVQPVKISEETFDERVVTLTGWGLTSFPGNRSNILQFMKLNTIDSERWQQFLWLKIQSQFFTLTTRREGVNLYDNGSPLVTNNYQVSIVSFGVSFSLPVYVDIKLAVCTRVSYVVDFLRNVTKVGISDENYKIFIVVYELLYLLKIKYLKNRNFSLFTTKF